ncbi:MAG: type II secretion system protein [Patescibacteria group bacterium]
MSFLRKEARSTLPGKSSLRGFTLIEIILSLALLTVIAGASFITSRTLIIDADLDAAVIAFVEGVRGAGMRSRGSDGDNQWGVSAQSGNIILFKGTSFAARDTTYDAITTIPTTITPSGTTEIVFAKLTGLPTSTGTLTLTGLQGQTRTLTINAKGTLSY